MRGDLEKLFWVLLVLLGLATLAASFGELSIWLDNVAAFRPALAFVAGLLLCGSPILAKQRLLYAGIALSAAFINVAIVFLSLQSPTGDDQVIASGRQSLLVVTANLNFENQSPEDLVPWLTETQADVVVLEELTRSHWLKLEPLLGQFPHRLVELRDDAYGIALLSKGPLERANLHTFGPEGIPPSIVATTRLGDVPVTIIGAHTLSPIDSDRGRWRNVQIEALAQFAIDTPMPVIVAGDLNLTPWSPAFAALRDRAKLGSAREDRGLYVTWPTIFPAPLRIPIDHILFGRQLTTTAVGVGPSFGSDHLPLWARIMLQNPL